MKILITGASGFIGRAWILSLAHRNHEIHALDVVPSQQEGIEKFYVQDLRAGFSLAEKYDFVFHFAAHNVTHVGVTDTTLYQDINVQGTINLIQACRTENFVFLSTAKVYESCGRPLVEGSPVGPQGDYEKSKLAAESVCRERLQGCRLCVLRPVNVVGPGQSPKAIIPVFFEKALSGQPIDIFGEGSTFLQLLYVADLVEAFQLILARGGVEGTLNLASSEKIRIEDLAEEIVRICHSRSALRHSGKDSRKFSEVISAKAEQVLGWTARTSIETMLQSCYEFIKNSSK